MIIETGEREVFVLSWPYAVLSTTIRTGSDGVLSLLKVCVKMWSLLCGSLLS